MTRKRKSRKKERSEEKASGESAVAVAEPEWEEHREAEVESAPPPEPVQEAAKPPKKETPPPRPRDLQMWVGFSHYATIESFVEEAERMGVSKRVSGLPVDVKLGETLLFLTHDEGRRIECSSCNGTGVEGGEVKLALEQRVPTEGGWRWEPMVRKGGEPDVVACASGTGLKELKDSMYKESKEQKHYVKVEGQPKCPRCKGWGRYPDGKIFGFCRLNAIELILDTPEAVREYREREQGLEKEGKVVVTPVVGGEGVEEERGCGFRSIGATYLVSGTKEALDELQKFAGELGAEFTIRGSFVELKNPVPYPHHRFFGTKLVDRKEILNGEARS